MKLKPTALDIVLGIYILAFAAFSCGIILGMSISKNGQRHINPELHELAYHE